MAKRGYKLQEFAAHSANVNCLNIGKKACRLFVTGGDDQKVNLWAIGKPTSLMSLCGHTSPVESVAFNSAEVLVLGGSSSGMIKLWDLEEAKMVRTLSGHRSNCTAVEFHPFGEFFASGSRDTNLKIWDIRKKGCIHTYKGHTQGISTIKFTPDGRWVVSGGFDSAVKVWDLTAGKLLHDFKFHEGPIRSIDFHPLEFLLATGSGDKTVKFWDLETFELIGSTRPEAAGLRAITFHPDGRTLFSGLDESLKVYSWEPVICHDSVDMGWSTLGDLCIHDGKLLSCSFYRNSVGVWVADISQIEPYGASAVSGQKEAKEQKSNSTFKTSPASKSIGAGLRTSDLQSMSPDYETKEIKNIYVDTTGGKPAASPLKGESLSSPKVVFQLDSKESSYGTSQKQSPTTKVEIKSNDVLKDKPPVVPCDSPDGKDSPSSIKDSITFSKTRRGMLLRPAHIRKPSNSKIDLEKLPASVDPRRKIDLERLPVVVDSVNICYTTDDLNKAPDPNLEIRVVSEEVPKDSPHETNSNVRSIEEKFEKVLCTETPSEQENRNKSIDSSKGINSVKFVNGVAVVPGRTRTLVERFERRERPNNGDAETIISPSCIPETEKTIEQTNNCEVQTVDMISHTPEKEKTRERTSNYVVQEMATLTPQIYETEKAREQTKSFEALTTITPPRTPETDKTGKLKKGEPQVSGRDPASANDMDVIEDLMQSHDVFLSSLRSRLTKLQVVRHFWGRNDMKGAINAMTKLPDHSVQADVVSVLIEKTDILTLDLFSCLLPVLVGLLDSKIERHASVSLEILLKLVAVFGHVVHSTVSAPPLVGVDLHAEQRLQCCKQCFIQLQKIHKVLPLLVRRGGLLARCAQELNLVLQQS